MANQTNTKTSKKADYIWAVGRRRTAVARVRLYLKDKSENALDITVNDKPIGQYFHNPSAQVNFGAPLKKTDTVSKYRVTVKVAGSGLESQLDAVNHALARALVKADAAHRATLKPLGFLTRDARKKQKRMIGRGGSARAKKQSPKR